MSEISLVSFAGALASWAAVGVAVWQIKTSNARTQRSIEAADKRHHEEIVAAEKRHGEEIDAANKRHHADIVNTQQALSIMRDYFQKQIEEIAKSTQTWERIQREQLQLKQQSKTAKAVGGTLKFIWELMKDADEDDE